METRALSSSLKVAGAGTAVTEYAKTVVGMPGTIVNSAFLTRLSSSAADELCEQAEGTLSALSVASTSTSTSTSSPAGDFFEPGSWSAVSRKSRSAAASSEVHVSLRACVAVRGYSPDVDVSAASETTKAILVAAVEKGSPEIADLAEDVLAAEGAVPEVQVCSDRGEEVTADAERRPSPRTSTSAALNFDAQWGTGGASAVGERTGAVGVHAYLTATTGVHVSFEAADDVGAAAVAKAAVHGSLSLVAATRVSL